MRILQQHVDFIEFEPVEKEIEIAEETEKKKFRFEEILVLFVSIEKNDDEKVAEKAIKEIKNFLQNLKLNKILIYPFAHLSNQLAEPNAALKILKKMEEFAKKNGIETYRAPFGWTKSFHLKLKGHPLAEQLRIYEVKEKEREEVSKALKIEEKKVKSKWYILEPNGNLVSVKEFDFTKHKNLEKFAKYEIEKSRVVKKIPPHVILMRKLEIADYESGSDPGNLRYYPAGRLIKSLLEEFVTRKVIGFGAMEVETPIMFDYNHPAFVSYLNRFPARHYVLRSGKKDYFMRFSACFGQFLIKKDMQISYKNLPLRMYELTRYSFRREKSGELVGLKRLRTFTMPDMHTLCKTLDEAKNEFKNQFKFSLQVLKEIGFDEKDIETAIRFTEDFWKENKEFIISLVKIINKPVLIEMWNFRYAYFDPKFEFNFVDALDKASALSTVQIDHENAERYGITYIDEDGKKKYPFILHCSPSGAIERVMYALLEKAYMKEKSGKVPSLPLWLSPTQVRLIPVSEKYIKACEEIADRIEKAYIRVDIDDRNESVERKVRDAEISWCPYIIVVGEEEVKSNKLSVRIREEGGIVKMDLNSLIEEIKNKVEGKPFKKLPLPKHLSKRPIFVPWGK